MCVKCNTSFWIVGTYNFWWKSIVDVSVMTSSFLVYNLAVNIESDESSHNWHCLFSLKVHMTCTVQRAICWYTLKHIVWLTWELVWSDYLLVRSMHGNFVKQHKTRLQCSNAYFNDGYTHIVAISISDDVLNMCLLFGMEEFYISQTGDWKFYQTLYFVCYNFYLYVFQITIMPW